jgi:16S rRNA (guanine(966)-N(2))-methyltransferase RsmD
MAKSASTPRVIAGKAKGVRLVSVPGRSIRPIMDRAKQALFDILGADIKNATFLDLFGGIGSVGIEALSRGAAFVRFIDADPTAIRCIRQNLTLTALDSGAQILPGDSFMHLRQRPDRRFDYVYVAPPQYHGLWQEALRALDAQPDWLSEDGWAIVQIHPKEYASLELNHLEEFSQRHYGSTLFVFFRHKEAAA